MRRYVFILLLFFSPLTAWCGELAFDSPRVNNGDVAVLRWQGEPLSFGVVRFQEKTVYLYPDPEGAIALLPIDLKTPSGDYTLLAATADMHGQTTATELVLSVVHKERPQESLRLPEEKVSPGPRNLKRILQEKDLLNEVFAQTTKRFWTTFLRPVDEPISSVFGKERLLNGKPRAPHSGVDFRSPAGTPVRTLSNGRVALVADLFYTGKTVVVDHGEGLFTLYAHLSKVLVEQGHELLVGEVLGEVGSTGRSTGPHLHLTVKLLGVRVDPISLIDAL